MNKLIVEGKCFSSKQEVAEAYGLTIQTVQMRIWRGWTIEQAVDLESPPETFINARNTWLQKKNIQERVCPVCKIQKTLTEFYKIKEGPYSCCKPCAQKRARNALRLKAYNLSEEEWAEKFKAQDSKCAICGTAENGGKDFSTDHNHSTNQTRGILCQNCNLGIGFSKENTEVLENAIKYLIHWSSQLKKQTIQFSALEFGAKDVETYVDPEEAA